MDATSQPKQDTENRELLKKLEKDGERQVAELLKTPPQSQSEFGNSLVNIMSRGTAEFKEKTGRNMTYSEMRQLYG
jgi:hypothetical protein